MLIMCQALYQVLLHGLLLSSLLEPTRQILSPFRDVRQRDYKVMQLAKGLS